MRKVLWISSVGEKGGAEVFMLNLLRRLDRRRYQPLVALLRPGPLADDLDEIDVPVIFYPTHRMRQVFRVGRTILDLAARARRENIRLVHSNGFRAHVYGGLAARQAGAAAIWTVHTAERDSLATSAILRIPARRVLANCPRTARWFTARGQATSILWPPVEPEILERASPRRAVAAKYNLPQAARWICMGPRMQRYKGHEYFIKALSTLSARFRDVHGIIMGGALFGMEPDFPAEMKSLAEKLGVSDRLHFTGHIANSAEVYGIISGSEFLVHPALDEDFGLIVAEAQALGRAVVAFAAVGPSAIIEDGRTGRLIEPIGDQDKLTSAMIHLLENPDAAKTWGAAGKARARGRFGAEAAARQLEGIYDSELDAAAQQPKNPAAVPALSNP